MKAMFNCVPKNGKMVYPSPDYVSYCLENDGIEMVSTFKPAAKMGEKERMLKYLFGPLLETAVYGYYQQGWNGIDKVKAAYMLRAEFAKDFIHNGKTGRRAVVIESIEGMDKARLLRFVQDVIFFCETDLQVRAPDSQEYKMMKLTGMKLKSTKNINL